jgi:hypothetical protein
MRDLKEADDLTILGIRWHPALGSRHEGWRTGLDNLMKPHGHGALWFRHLGDLGEHVAFPVCHGLVRARFRL